jgi:ComF family protein
MRCGECIRRPPLWDDALAAMIYEYPIDQLVQRFKFQRSLACGQLLADKLVSTIKAAPLEKPDVLIPVPLHFTRRLQRGFNQAEFLARQLGKSLTIPLSVNQLRRSRRTRAQSGLDRAAREKNIRGSFTCRSLQQCHIALVDDVMTTGTTLRECTRAVRVAGASRVSIWVAARVPSVK